VRSGYPEEKWVTLHYLRQLSSWQDKVPNIIKIETMVHSPTLSTVFMVEETLKNAESIITTAELKRRLPKKVMHQTLIQILDYLQLWY